jgi:peroxiredoxin
MTRLYALALAALLAAVHQGALGEIEPGQPAPDFALSDLAGHSYRLSSYKGKYVVLEWFNPECTFVQKHYASGNMQSLQKRYGDEGVVWLTINSTHPDSDHYRDPDRLAAVAEQWKMAPSALLLDPEGKVGSAYGARTTPQVWVIEPGGKVIYAGGIDDKPTMRPGDRKDAKNYVALALDESMAGAGVTTPVAPPYGCAVKYRN